MAWCISRRFQRNAVENVSDKLSEGDFVKVKVLEIDRQGRVRLSMKAVDKHGVE